VSPPPTDDELKTRLNMLDHEIMNMIHQLVDANRAIYLKIIKDWLEENIEKVSNSDLKWLNPGETHVSRSNWDDVENCGCYGGCCDCPFCNICERRKFQCPGCDRGAVTCTGCYGYRVRYPGKVSRFGHQRCTCFCETPSCNNKPLFGQDFCPLCTYENAVATEDWDDFINMIYVHVLYEWTYTQKQVEAISAVVRGLPDYLLTELEDEAV